MIEGLVFCAYCGKKLIRPLRRIQMCTNNYCDNKCKHRDFLGKKHKNGKNK